MREASHAKPQSSDPRSADEDDRALKGPTAAGAGLVLVAAAGFGTLGVISRFAGDAGLSAASFATWRAVLGAGFLLAAVALMVRAGRLHTIGLATVPRLHWLQVSSVAFLTVITNLALFSAFERTTIALVLICFYTYPVIVAIAAIRIYGDPLTPPRIAALTLASLGMLMVVLAPVLGETGLDVEAAGLALGLVAALSQAAYSLIAGRGCWLEPPSAWLSLPPRSSPAIGAWGRPARPS